MRKLLILMLLTAFGALSAIAQSQSTSGNIEGRVVDPNGAVVPGISVSATNQDNGFGKVVTTDSDGNYIFVLLPPGNYKVEVAAAKGFAAAAYSNVTSRSAPKRRSRSSSTPAGPSMSSTLPPKDKASRLRVPPSRPRSMNAV